MHVPLLIYVKKNSGHTIIHSEFARVITLIIIV